MKLLALDPGSFQSAFLLFDIEREEILDKGILPNTEIFKMLLESDADHLCIEAIASYGMAVGAEVFETVFWSGRFTEYWISVLNKPTSRLFRRDVKMNLCNSMRAKDANIRQALIDRFGQPGTKKAPGKTYGISKDIWSALAIAVTWKDLQKNGVDSILMTI